MNGLFINRNKVVTDDMLGDCKAVILDCINEDIEPKRNPNLDAQLKVVNGWNVPILFRVVSQAQWYCDLITDLHDDAKWEYAMNLYTLKDMSALLRNPHRAQGWVIACARDDTRGTTNTWIAETMKHVQAKASEKWILPFWYEFSTDELDKDTSKQLVTLKDNQRGEWIARTASNTDRATSIVTLPDNLYDVLGFKPSETPVDPVVDPVVPDTGTGGGPCGTLELAKLSDIELTLDAIKITLDGVFKLLEAYAPWVKK